MRYGIPIPQFAAGGVYDPAALKTFLTRAEELGFENAWTQEQTLGSKPILGVNETLAYAAAVTEHIRIGCAVYVLPLQSPVHLAKSLSTLDQLSGGRLEVGVGAGGKGRPFAAFGMTPEGLITRFTEGLQVMRALWTQEKVTFDGRFLQLDGASMEPKPIQKGGPPVWFGGSVPAALSRAVKYGDGFFGAGSSTTVQYIEQVRAIRALLDEQQRDPATFPIAKRVYIAVDDDKARAEERMRQALAEIYSTPGMPDFLPVAVYGTANECVEGLQAVADAGAERILVNPLFDLPEQMERLAAEVLPHVK
jgi:probable F420-dependent oxidoreductase